MPSCPSLVRKAFAEIAAKVEFEQCGEVLRHGVFITLPLVFAYILLPYWFIAMRLPVARVVFDNVKSLLAYSVIVPVVSAFSLPTCKRAVPFVKVMPCVYVLKYK